MNNFLGTLFILALGTVLASAEYRYYYSRPSYRSLCQRIEQLEKKVKTMEQPIHVHVSGNEDQASMSSDGTHIHVHVDLDGKNGVSPVALKDEYSYAYCNVQPNVGASPNVVGAIYLRQKPSSKIEMKVDLSGFPGQGQYGFHVHEVVDFRRGCNSFGGHYNPYKKTHGGPDDDIRHVGDLGNLQVDRNGQVKTTITDHLASLFGSESIVGRGFVVHAGTDDLGRGGDAGSLATGNAGSRLSCCAIGWSTEDTWNAGQGS